MADPETPAPATLEEVIRCPHTPVEPPGRCYLKHGPSVAAAFRPEDTVRVCPTCLKPTDEIDATPAPV
jgi:hypothetical protein